METPLHLRCALTIGAAAALLAGCGALQPPTSSSTVLENLRTKQFTAQTQLGPQKQTAPEFKLSGGLLYVVDFDMPPYAGVEIYPVRRNDPSPEASITKGLDGANGDCVDSTGTLYVADQDGWVAEYAPGKTKPLTYITKGLSTPGACTIDANGNLWVADVSVGVVEFLKGSKKPNKIINKGLTSANSVVFDQVGNMYVGNLLGNEGQSSIQVYPPDGDSPSRAITDGVTWPVGTAVDAGGTLYVTNLTNANSGCGDVEEYRSGQGNPYKTITNEMNGPDAITIGKDGRLYIGEPGIAGCENGAHTPVILEFRHGSVEPSKRTITQDLRTVSGMAYYPPLLL